MSKKNAQGYAVSDGVIDALKKIDGVSFVEYNEGERLQVDITMPGYAGEWYNGYEPEIKLDLTQIDPTDHKGFLTELRSAVDLYKEEVKDSQKYFAGNNMGSIEELVDNCYEEGRYDEEDRYEFVSTYLYSDRPYKIVEEDREAFKTKLLAAFNKDFERAIRSASEVYDGVSEILQPEPSHEKTHRSVGGGLSDLR